MNRQIRFRAWDIDQKEMIDFNEDESRYISFNDDGATIQDLYDNEVFLFCVPAPREQYVEEAVLMQFTGLHDKNGKDIFEGDIIRSGMRVGDGAGWTNEKVIQGEFGEWLLADLKTGEKMQMQRDIRLREVIGNVFQNPELLK